MWQWVYAENSEGWCVSGLLPSCPLSTGCHSTWRPWWSTPRGQPRARGLSLAPTPVGFRWVHLFFDIPAPRRWSLRCSALLHDRWSRWLALKEQGRGRRVWLLTAGPESHGGSCRLLFIAHSGSTWRGTEGTRERLAWTVSECAPMWALAPSSFKLQSQLTSCLQTQRHSGKSYQAKLLPNLWPEENTEITEVYCFLMLPGSGAMHYAEIEN